MQIKGLRIIFLTLFLSVVLTFAGFSVNAESEPIHGGTLELARVDDATELDPHTTTAHPSRRIFELVYSNLIGLDADMQPVPELAESWDISEEGDEYTFYLRDDVYFHNGDHMTSEDVAYSIERILDEETGAAARSHIADIENVLTPDDYTIVFELKSPNASMLLHLADANAVIVNKAVAEADSLNSVENTVGTGPFQLSEWYPDEEMTLIRHADFYEEDKPYLDEIRFTVIPEEFSIVAGLRTGQTDFALLNLPTAALAIEEQTPNVTLSSELSLRWTPLFVNTEREPLDDIRVRQAINYAINREEMIASAMLGEAEPIGPIPSSLTFWAYDVSQSPFYQQDIDRAEELLREAGYEDGFTISINFMSGYEEVLSQVQVLQNQLEKVNINLELNSLERGIYIDRWVDADFDLSLSTNAGAADPDFYLFRYFHSEGSLAFIHGHWSNDRVDTLLEEGRREVDEELRQEIYLEAQEILIEEAPFIWLNAPYEYFAFADHVKGFTPLPTGGINYLKDVWLDN